MAKDYFHNVVKAALEEDGWEITFIIFDIENQSVLEWKS